jgi:DNA-binding winged helix-turn-helix (wHTH) protein/TolB-like protein
MEQLAHQEFLVGDYRVAPSEGRVSGPGGTRQLCTQTIALLELFAEHPGQVIERRQIIEHVCRDCHRPEQVVTRCVSELRRCLGDDSHHPRYIQTVTGQGYRLIAAVALPDSSGHCAPCRSVSQLSFSARCSALLFELRQRKVCRAALLYMLVVWLVYQIAEIVIPALQLPDWTLTLVVLLGIFGFPLVLVLAWAFEMTPHGLVIDLPRSQLAPLGRSSRRELVLTGAMLMFACVISVQLACASLGVEFGGPGGKSKPAIRALAVGDFVATGPGPQSEALSHGIVDELRRLLLDSGQLRVMVAPRTSVAALHDLAADVLLEGSVNVEAGRVRATVHLVDAQTGYDIWSIALDEVEGSAAALQQRLAERIAMQLPITALKGPGVRAATRPVSGEAHFAQVTRPTTSDRADET